MKTPTPPSVEITSPLLTSLRWMAGLTGLIALLGLMALASEDSWAQEGAPNGFTGGTRPFNNPFAAGGSAPGGAPPPPPGNSFFDDAEDEEEFRPPPLPTQPRAGMDEPPRSGFGGGSNSSQGAGSRGASGISMGGSPQSIITKKEMPALNIDSETAEGSKEMVTEFNFPDADILDIAKTLGKLTGKNFILDKDVKGRITIISNGQITVGDAWRAFLTALDMNGFALIPSGKFLRIARQRDARDKQLKTYTGDFAPDTDALITRVFPLKYLSSEEVARNFRSFMPANSRIIPYEQTNTVIVTDTGSNIAKLQKLLELLDVEGYDAGIEVIPVKFASAAELSKLIDTLIPGTSTAPGAGGGRFTGGAKFASRRTKEGGIINTIIADERTNTLIVHANTKGADQVRALVARLDQKLPATAGGGKVHVVYLQFAASTEIAKTLNELSQSSASSRPAGAPGGTGINPVQQSLFEGAIKVAADAATNSLVITASPSDFITVQRVIHKLDIPRDQVYAEVVIMEMAVNRDFEYSSNVINPTNGLFLNTNTDLVDFITSPGAQKGAILSFADGAKRTLTVGGNNVTVSGVQGLIKALQTNSNANILATPQILTLDNTEATFETAEKIPFPTTTAVNGAVGVGISKENVSLTVTIKPQINKLSNFVKLDVQAKLADISGREPPKQVRDIAFATIERNAKTSVVVADKDTIVLGGLMRDNQSEATSKIPILGDIPILGWLFKSTRSTTSKTNLMIFITPHIVRQYERIRALLDKKLQERDEFIEAAAGGRDLSRPFRDQMIRSLPDMKEITSYKPQAVQSIDSSIPPGGGTPDAGTGVVPGPETQTSPSGDATPPGTPETAPLEAQPDAGTVEPQSAPLREFPR